MRALLSESLQTSADHSLELSASARMWPRSAPSVLDGSLPSGPSPTATSRPARQPPPLHRPPQPRLSPARFEAAEFEQQKRAPAGPIGVQGLRSASGARPPPAPRRSLPPRVGSPRSAEARRRSARGPEVRARPPAEPWTPRCSRRAARPGAPSSCRACSSSERSAPSEQTRRSVWRGRSAPETS